MDIDESIRIGCNTAALTVEARETLVGLRHGPRLGIIMLYRTLFSGGSFQVPSKASGFGQ